jgi:hypothetical protein
MNIRHEVLDWFGLLRGVIALRPVLMYYAIEISSPPFLLGSFEGSSGILRDVLDVNLSSLFIVRKSPRRV